MSATTSKTGRNGPQTGCFKDQEFRSFKGPLLENILHEKLTVSDSTANGYLALSDSYVTKLLQLLRKSQQHDPAYFLLVYVVFQASIFYTRQRGGVCKYHPLFTGN